MNRLTKFLRSERGAGAAEFALVLPATLLLFFGVIDGGRYLWAVNRLEKAVQMGTRTAVVTSVVASSLNTANYSGFLCPTYNSDGTPTGGTTPIKVGDPICKEAVPTITCSKSGTSVTCGGAAGNANAFNRILSRMRVVDPSIRDDEVDIIYSGSGIGYVGDPSVTDAGAALADAAPVVTVSVDRARMRALFLLGGSIPLPGFNYSQTLEDGDGVVAY